MTISATFMVTRPPVRLPCVANEVRFILTTSGTAILKIADAQQRVAQGNAQVRVGDEALGCVAGGLALALGFG